MKVYVESKDDIKELTADNRGRVYLGSEYADETVQLAILDTIEEGDTSD